ncbi:MAG TPA: isoprenylcysteine carboxylmethyltransferase family protein [Pyrinomonadaceae bacterium]|nr:isoprenylcysteine carboxylmethyltransferase family protein [Pyrinomonadaceae bacterium]
MVSLLLRNLLFTILQPGLVTGLLPYLLLRSTGRTFLPEVWTSWHFVGAAIALAGLLILVRCILRFATEGRGTISPIDPTTKLVERGLYRYSRNPMYLGAIVLLIGEAIFWRSLIVAGYAALVFIAFNLFIVFHEEPRLRRVFGAEYEAYFGRARRWL